MAKVNDKDVIALYERGRADYSWFMTHALDVKPAHV